MNKYLIKYPTSTKGLRFIIFIYGVAPIFVKHSHFLYLIKEFC